MAPSNKAKAAGVSASSFFDLKAELAKHEEEFTKNKAAGKSTALVGGVKRPEKVSLGLSLSLSHTNSCSNGELGDRNRRYGRGRTPE